MAEVDRQIYWLRSVLIVTALILVWLFGRPFVTLMLARFEQTAFEQVLRQLNSACQARVIEAKAGKGQSLREWLESNPVDCLPEEGLSTWDYRGDEIAIDQQQAGTWVYDQELAELRYRWRHPERLNNQDPEADLVRFKLMAEFADTNSNGQLDNNESINGLYLKAKYSYQWQ